MRPWTVRPALGAEVDVLAAVHRATATRAFAGMFPPEAPVPPAAEFLGAWHVNFTPEAAAAGTRAFVAEWALERNTMARGWYERLGWQLTGGRKPVYAPAHVDDVEYAIELGAN